MIPGVFLAEQSLRSTIFTFMPSFITEWPQYFTATILEWKKLLQPDKYKYMITESLRFLVQDGRIRLYAFVVMVNHIHLIWQICADYDPEAVQRDFLKFTAQKMKADLRKYHPVALEHFRVNAREREYQFWERNALSIELRSHAVFIQKLDYIHWNPVRAGLCRFPEEYEFSSARFYETGLDNWGFLTHYRDY